MLEQLVEAATTDASADEVTPPSTVGPAWTPTRIAWLHDFHRDRRTGLDGPAREIIWAITVDQRVVGSVCLQRMERPGLLETGVWLTRSSRGHGVGGSAMAAALGEAGSLGFTAVRAETTVNNAGALAVLEQLGLTSPALVKAALSKGCSSSSPSCTRCPGP